MRMRSHGVMRFLIYFVFLFGYVIIKQNGGFYTVGDYYATHRTDTTEQGDKIFPLQGNITQHALYKITVSPTVNQYSFYYSDESWKVNSEGNYSLWSSYNQEEETEFSDIDSSYKIDFNKLTDSNYTFQPNRYSDDIRTLRNFYNTSGFLLDGSIKVILNIPCLKSSTPTLDPDYSEIDGTNFFIKYRVANGAGGIWNTGFNLVDEPKTNVDIYRNSNNKYSFSNTGSASAGIFNENQEKYAYAIYIIYGEETTNE